MITEAMGDYYTAEQLCLKLGISERELEKLEARGFLQPVVKNGRRFYSAQQAYQLRAALQLVRKQKMSLEEAFMRLRDRRLFQVEVSGVP